MSAVLVDAPGPGVGRITFNRPKVLNAINAELLKDFADAMDAMEADDGVRAVILTGAGRAFSAGFDLKEDTPNGSISADEWVDRFRRQWDVLLRVWRSAKPYVAVVRGYSLGGAQDLALLADITLASSDAKFGMPEIRHAAGPGASLLPWAVGMKAAKRIMLTGEMLTADEAKAVGIVTDVVSEEELDERSVEIAERLALIAPSAMKLTKLAINRTYERQGMLTAIADSQTITSIANTSPTYQLLEDQRKTESLGDYFDRRDRPFEGAETGTSSGIDAEGQT